MNAKKKNKIPKFKSFKEEAQFWDSHDFTDYLSDLKPTRVIFSSGLVRMWLVERLRNERIVINE